MVTPTPNAHTAPSGGRRTCLTQSSSAHAPCPRDHRDLSPQCVGVCFLRRHRRLPSQGQGGCTVSGLRRPWPPRVSAVRRRCTDPARHEGQPIGRRRRALRSRRRNRYERQGILAEAAAIEQAAQECLSDADVRARRRKYDQSRRADQDVAFRSEFAAAIREQFPGCPDDRAEAIAFHAAARGSGRVGRSAAGRALDPEAVRLAVIASARHVDTDYDTLLMSGCRPRVGSSACAPRVSRTSSTRGATVSRCSTDSRHTGRDYSDS